MSMKKMTLISLLMALMPFIVMAQSNDDLYFIPKKKAEKKTTKVVVEGNKQTTAVYASPGTTVVVKDAQGNARDVDEYNRRYTSRDNTFTLENDTLYIEEKPYNERGEWVNGFEGSQSDYEYAMRIVRFRNPRYAIPVSSPLYWEVVYALPSWDWNVYDDGLYAYVFPSYTNRLWFDWRFDYSWRWHRPWYYGSWHSPYWYGHYWGVGHWGHHHHWHSHHLPHFAWGGYWGKSHGWHGSSAHRPGIHAGRYNNKLRIGNVNNANVSRRKTTGVGSCWRQFLSTFTCKSSSTLNGKIMLICFRAAALIDFIIVAPFPITIPFWLSLSTHKKALTQSFLPSFLPSKSAI